MEKLTQIINNWDPIGFFPMAPKDEYSDEIQLIYQYLCDNHNIDVEDLSKKIDEIFVKKFGDDIYWEDIEKCRDIAKQILTSIKL